MDRADFGTGKVGLGRRDDEDTRKHMVCTKEDEGGRGKHGGQIASARGARGKDTGRLTETLIGNLHDVTIRIYV